MQNYYVIELINDYESDTNSKGYKKGTRLMVYAIEGINLYWVVNVGDAIPYSIAKKIYNIETKEIKEV